MTGPEPKRRRTGAVVVAAAALVVVVYSATSGRRESETDIPTQAVGWHGAMSLYRNLALWAGKRAMSAELNYWKAVS